MKLDALINKYVVEHYGKIFRDIKARDRETLRLHKSYEKPLGVSENRVKQKTHVQ